MEKELNLADIPFLPQPEPGMNWRSLNRFKNADRTEAFYLTCLQYAQQLWRERLPARAILCLDRAWAADLHGGEPALRAWPLPYRALVHILKEAPRQAFLGNPRVHFQHYADRLGQPRREQRKWRSWACWLLVRKARPDLPADPKHLVREPTFEEITEHLLDLGHPGERELWQDACSELEQL